MRAPFLPCVLLTGCIPTIAPPAHYAAMGPTVAVAEPEIEVAASCCTLPALDIAFDAPIGGRGLLATQIQGQLGPAHGAVSPALVLRSRGEATRVGLMLGVTGGMGDFFGVVPYRMPWGAGGLHFLLTAPMGSEHRSRFTMATGAEVSQPIIADWAQLTVEGTNGEELPVLPLPNAFLSLDLRFDIATRGEWWFFVGGGLDISLYGFAVPALTLGGRGGIQGKD